MYGDVLSKNNPFNTREKIFRELTRCNVATVEVQFSGGGDEGSVNRIRLFNADGVEINVLEEAYISSEYDEKTKNWKPTREMTRDEMLAEALSQPVYDKYGGFDGDFSVDGKICWNVKERTVTESGERSCSESYDDSL
jgi:hypothetical protein